MSSDNTIVFQLPDPETLKKFVDKARVDLLMGLFAKLQEGSISASEGTLLLRVATEVEAMIPAHIRERAADTASHILSDDFESPFTLDDVYDPMAPLQ